MWNRIRGCLAFEDGVLRRCKGKKQTSSSSDLYIAIKTCNKVFLFYRKKARGSDPLAGKNRFAQFSQSPSEPLPPPAFQHDASFLSRRLLLSQGDSLWDHRWLSLAVGDRGHTLAACNPEGPGSRGSRPGAPGPRALTSPQPHF